MGRLGNVANETKKCFDSNDIKCNDSTLTYVYGRSNDDRESEQQKPSFGDILQFREMGMFP